MSLKDSLKAKIKIERLTEKIKSTLRETPGDRNLNKEAMEKLLVMSDFEPRNVRDLRLYVRSSDQGEEVLVLDNELPIYHSTIEDVAMRKSPHWKEMFRIGNIRKVLNDQDVIVSRGRSSLLRVYENALSQLDLTCTEDDINELVQDARMAMESRSHQSVRESLDLFLELLEYQPLDLLEKDLHAYGRPQRNGGESEQFESIVFFDEDKMDVRSVKGIFALDNDQDLDRLVAYGHGERREDLSGIEVFEFLAEMALREKTAVTA